MTMDERTTSDSIVERLGRANAYLSRTETHSADDHARLLSAMRQIDSVISEMSQGVADDPA